MGKECRAGSDGLARLTAGRAAGFSAAGIERTR